MPIRNTGGPPPSAPFMSSRARRHLMVSLHVIASVGLIGCHLILLALGITGRDDPQSVLPAFTLISESVIRPMALLALVSGLTIGLLTPWGLFRHRWVTIKFILTLAYAAAAVFLLPFRISTVAESGQGFSSLLIVPNVAAALLLVNVLLAIHKPFGRTMKPAKSP